MKRIDVHLFVLLAFSLIALAPLTAPGYFILAHDARHTVYFLQMFDAALRDGALYPRWAADMTFGYGYPVWLILAPLPYYLGESFHLVGLDFVSAAKAIDAVGLIASGLAAYAFTSRILGKDAGLLAAVAYLFVPYHLVNLYVRGAAPEFLSYVFPPIILLGLYELIARRRVHFAPLAALAYGGLVLTHIQGALVFSPVIGIYILLLWVLFKPVPVRFIALPIISILLGILLSSTFLLPVLLEQRYLTSEPLTGGFFDPSQHFISVSQLLSPFWGYGYAGINGTDQFSLQLGIVPIFLAAIALFGLNSSRSVISAHLLFFVLVSVVAIVLMLPLSASVWSLAAPVLGYLQFPWRLLILTALSLAFLCGSSLLVLPQEETFFGALLFSILLVLAMFSNAHPQYTEARFNNATLMDFEVKDRELLGDTVWLRGPRPNDSPLVEQYRAGAITQKAVIVEGNGNVQLLARDSQHDEVQVTADQPVRVEFYTHYFPGWQVAIDGEPTSLLETWGDQGLISVKVPAGTHIVRAYFTDTSPRVIGAVVSLLALIACFTWLWWEGRARGRTL